MEKRSARELEMGVRILESLARRIGELDEIIVRKFHGKLML